MSFVLAKPRLILTFPKKALFQASKISIFKVPGRLFFTDPFDKYLLPKEVQRKRGKGKWDGCRLLASDRIVISCLLVSTRLVMTNRSVKCQPHRLGPFSPNISHYLIRGPWRKWRLHNFMGLNRAGWLAEKLPRRVDKAMVILFTPLTPCSQHWQLQKKSQIDLNRNRAGHGETERK